MKYLFPPPQPVSIAIYGKNERFPINRIFCVGRNYSAHAREMGSDPEKEPPFFFMKPASAVVEVINNQARIPYPPMTNNFHYEVELVAVIGPKRHDVNPQNASAHVYGYAIGLDMTRRDLQLDAREKGQPWELGKSLSNSALVGPVYPVDSLGQIGNAEIKLEVNGNIKQQSNIQDLIWSVPEIIAHLTRYEPIQPGDLIMTGTPEGVGPVVTGDVIRGHIDGLGEINVSISDD